MNQTTTLPPPDFSPKFFTSNDAMDDFDSRMDRIIDKWFDRILERAKKRLAAPTQTTCSTECPSGDTTTSTSAFTIDTAPTSAAAIVDVIHVLAAPAASDGTLDGDTISGAASTPTTCSTGGTVGDGPGTLFLIPRSVAHSFTEPPELSRAQLGLDNLAPFACSLKCLVDTNATPSRLLQAAAPVLIHELKVLRPLPWPSFKCSQAWTLLQPEEFRSLLMITSAGTTRQQSVGEKSIIPMSTSRWLLQVPSMVHADGHEVRPMSWPPFDCSLGDAHLKHAGPLPQATYVMKLFSGELTSLRESLRCLQCVQPNPCISEKVACWISHGPRAVSVPSHQGIQLMVICYVQSAYEFFARDTQASGTRMLLVSIKLRPWPMLKFNHGKCPVMIVLFTSTSGNTELQSTPKHLKKSVHWQSLGEEELEGSGTCTSDTMLTEGKEVIITMLSAIIYCYSTVSGGQTKWPCTFGTDKKKPWPPPQGLLSHQSTCEPHGYFFLDTICHALHARSSLSEYYAQVPLEQASQDWAQRWGFGISASTRADAWIDSRFNGTNCRVTDTATGLLKLYVDFGNSLPRNSLSPIFAVVEIWQYLSDGPPLLLWPPTSQEGFSMAELKGISCSETFTTHAGYLIYLDFSNIGLMVSAATQKEQVNCQARQSYACYILQPMAGVEYFAHWDIIYKFCQEALTLVRELWHTYHFSFSCVALVNLVQWHNVLIGDLLCAPSLTLSMSIECRGEQQTEKSHSFIAATGLDVCTMNKRMLQIVEEFRGLIPTITVGNYGSTTSVCAGEDDMATRKLSGVLVLRRAVPWDPGGSTWHPRCSTGRDHEPFQGGRVVIPVVAFVEQGFIDHEYYPGFDQDSADNDFFIGAFFGGASISHNYRFYLGEVYPGFGYHHDSDQVQEHRVQWDPGGSRWRRLGVKPSFKEGGVLATFPTRTRTWAFPLGNTWAGPVCAPPSAAGYKYTRGGYEQGIRDGSRNGGGWFSSHLWLSSPSPFFLFSLSTLVLVSILHLS